MAAALAGERSSLDTVVYVCCDMLNACELVSDVERAVQWCAVVDEFVATYGCPFLYAECRTYYGSVLITTGRWDEAERELRLALKVTDGACPGLHAKALARLARLRTLQGRLEEADQLLTPLGTRVEMRADIALAVAALLLARGDASAATRHLEQRTDQINEGHAHLTAALDLLVDAHLAAATRRRPLSGHVWRSPTQVARRRFELARVLADRSPEISIEHAGHALRAFEELGAASTPIGSLRSYGHRASGRGPAPTASGP